MAKIDTTDRFPWNEIEERTVDGQSMVFIPKIYVKTEVDENNLPTWWISKSKKTGFHIHPAFMWDGHETPEGILISKYVAGGSTSAPTSLASQTRIGSVNYNQAQTAGQARNVTGGTDEQKGWHSYNIYEHHLIARLMLIEYGTADLQNQIGGSATAMGITYHGITDVWGNNSYGFWIDGLDTLGDNNGTGSANTTLRILDNLGNGTMVDTGISVDTLCKNWVVNVSTASGTNFDLGDVFIGTTYTDTESAGTFGDYQGVGYGGCVFGTAWGSSSYLGPFSLDYYAPSSSPSALGFRLAKWC